MAYSGHCPHGLMTLTFADDLGLFSHSHTQMQDKTTWLGSTSAKIGLHINNGETKIMGLSTKVTAQSQEQALEEVNIFIPS